MSSSYTIEISTEEPRWQKAMPRVEAWCEDVCATALDACAVGNYAPQAGVSILLADDQRIQGLNQQYRGKDKATNVLSFPQVMLSPQKLSVLAEDHQSGVPVSLGDIILSYDTIAREAEDEGKSIQAHAAHMLVHAVLHLLGYDHMADTQAEIMETKEAAVLASLGIENPYTVPHGAA